MRWGCCLVEGDGPINLGGMKNNIETENRVYDYIKGNGLIAEGERILVGFSGGADSTALLFVLKSLGGGLGADIVAVHIEHGIRGDESERDMDFCISLCKRLDVTIKVFREEVPEYAKSRGLGLEEAARELRYRDFATAAKEFGASKIAVAHHGDD